MKLLKKKDKYLLELNRFELDSFALISNFISGKDNFKNIFNNDSKSFLEEYFKKTSVLSINKLSKKLNVSVGGSLKVNKIK